MSLSECVLEDGSPTVELGNRQGEWNEQDICVYEIVLPLKQSVVTKKRLTLMRYELINHVKRQAAMCTYPSDCRPSIQIHDVDYDFHQFKKRDLMPSENDRGQFT